jgi:hypothetical protein
LASTTGLARGARVSRRGWRLPACPYPRPATGKWKTDRLSGHDPIAKWESALASKEAKKVAQAKAVAVEAAQPTVNDAIDQFMVKHIAGKKSAPAIRYRLDRLAAYLGAKKIRDVTR